MHSRLLKLIPLALVALALLVPASASAIERTVSVGGSATLKVANDTATFGFSASAERRSRGAALRVVSARLGGVIAAVQTIPGVGAGDVQTGRISVDKRLRGKKVLYRASEGIGVTLHEPSRAGDLVTAAIGAGASGVSGPNFFVGDTEAAYALALRAAFVKARAKAEALAAEAGAGLGEALAITEGENSELLPEQTAKSAPAADCAAPVATTKPSRKRCAASPPTKPGTSTVTASVRVIFALE